MATLLLCSNIEICDRQDPEKQGEPRKVRSALKAYFLTSFNGNVSQKAGARQLSRLFNGGSQTQEQETDDSAKQDQSWDPAQKAKVSFEFNFTLLDCTSPSAQRSDQQSRTDNNDSTPGQKETQAERYASDGKDGDGKEPPKDHWQYCYEAIDKRDEKFCKRLQDEVNALLLIASLLLAVITAFTIESFKWLQEDPNGSSLALLRQIVVLLNDTTMQGTVTPSATSFQPADYQLRVNQIWSASMILSFTAVLFGTLCLQWLSSYRYADDDEKYVADADTLALRQVRYEGLLGWNVQHIPSMLVLILQATLIFFIVGLLYLLWNVNKRAGLPVAITGGISLGLLAIALFLPVLLPMICHVFPEFGISPGQYPFKSRWSWFVFRCSIVLEIVFSYPLTWIPSIKSHILEWRKDLRDINGDWNWKGYDQVWRRRREPKLQDSEPGYCSYYLLHGLRSVLQTLGSGPDTDVHFPRCLKELKFHRTLADAEAFERSFKKELTNEEKSILDFIDLSGPPEISEKASDPQTSKSGRPLNSTSHHSKHAASEGEDVSGWVGHDRSRPDLPKRTPEQPDTPFATLWDCFLTALILEHLVAPFPAIRRSLLSLRVFYYIRFKKLADHAMKVDLGQADKSTAQLEWKGIGRDITCPIVTKEDVLALSPTEREDYIKELQPLQNSTSPNPNWRYQDKKGFKLVHDQSDKAKQTVPVDRPDSLEGSTPVGDSTAPDVDTYFEEDGDEFDDSDIIYQRPDYERRPYYWSDHLPRSPSYLPRPDDRLALQHMLPSFRKHRRRDYIR
ncbi:hypothetical protein D9756_010829 [Leucocoprinus leucothites]|uniref:DUF6535 domain-containing protein n=1 Tax=Leucocoprinus leucothites TaxID=201217 RepID=A0A8H5CR21_9AGAR|nr:hypothetical protein D9756_010829 [Leucoagaricus leucothites]